MKKSVLYTCISLLCLLLASCETEIKYEGEITDPQMVVFANLFPDSAVSCYVLHSFFFMDVPSNIKYSDSVHEEEVLKDAVVRCKINDGEWIALDSITPQKAYISSKPAAVVHASDKVVIDVEHPIYGHTSAEQIVPQNAKIELIDYNIKPDTVLYNQNRAENSYRIDYNITIRLKAYTTSEKTIGRLRATISQNEQNVSVGMMSSSVVFAELNPDMTEEGLAELFESDDYSYLVSSYQQLYYPMEQVSAQGEEMVLYVTLNEESVRMYNFYYEGKLNIISDVLTQDCYLYIVSMTQYKNTTTRIIGLGQQEKVQIYGNFSGNVIGCMSAQTNPTIIEIDLPKFK